MALDKAFIAKMKDQLTKEREGLQAQLARVAKKDPKTPGDYDAKWPSYDTGDQDPEQAGDNALESEDYANAIGVENILELRLLAVERALRRIARGTYGQCGNCAHGQPVARLEADPAAERCIECKESV